MMDNGNTIITFTDGIQIDPRQHIIPNDIAKKYPNSVFNYCTDFREKTINFGSDIITYDDFEEVIKILNSQNLYWTTSNKKAKQFVKNYIFINDTLQLFYNTLKNEICDKIPILEQFIYGKEKIYAPSNMKIYHLLKTSLVNKNIVSVQCMIGDGAYVININETIPIYYGNLVDNISMLKCNNKFDINEARYQVLCKDIKNNKIPKYLYSNERYFTTCAYMSSTLHDPGRVLVVNKHEMKFVKNPKKRNVQMFEWDESVLQQFGGDCNALISKLIINNNLCMANCGCANFGAFRPTRVGWNNTRCYNYFVNLMNL